MKRVFLALLVAFAVHAHAAVTPLPGVTPQRAPALTPFPVPVAVLVTDAGGQPVAGVRAYFMAGVVMQVAPGASGECWIDFIALLACRAVTDAAGIARFPAMMARHAEAFTASVHATNDVYPGTINYGETTLQFTSDALQESARLTIQGNDQRAVIGTALGPITVRVVDSLGQPRRQAKVWYAPYGGGPGAFYREQGVPPEVFTDNNGLATLPQFTAAWGLGDHEAEVRHFDPQAAVHLSAKIRYTATNAQGGSNLEMGDLWWNGPAESGWGMSINQRGDRLFNVWFVYGEDGRPTWYVQPGGAWSGGVGGNYSGDVYSPRSAPWFAYDATKLVAGTRVSQGGVGFQGPQAAITHFIADIGESRYGFLKEIVRQRFGGNDAAPLPGVGGLWWGGPAQNGWGVAVHEQGAKLFIVWFTYAADGTPTWFAMPDGQWTDDRTYAGTIYKTVGPAWRLEDFDTTAVQATPVGDFTLRFDTRDAGRMDVMLEGRSLSLDLVRQLF